MKPFNKICVRKKSYLTFTFHFDLGSRISYSFGGFRKK